MAEFSADAEQRALEPWTIRIDGRVHTARPVSRMAMLAFLAVTERYKAGTATAEEVEGALYALLRAAFPRHRFRDWWRGDVVAKILALDYRVREDALVSFFESLGLTMSPSAPGTNGKNGVSPSSGGGHVSTLAPPSGASVGGSRRD